MPPSPALRCSPGRELRAENHKRGRSLESGLLLREKDDDLALFNEMQTRERDNFLLHTSDNFDDSLSTKLRYFSDIKLAISIPIRGESSDLLNADGEKNDYDWLLTPPDTPLFRSLDDEIPPVNLATRGRPRSQPISISRSATMEKNYRTSRSSASPHRLSPSPRSGNSKFQSRGRPSSAPHSSPAPVLRSTTPSRRPSTPPNRPSTPAPRSSTPTPRRMSAGSSGTIASSGIRGTSPVKTTRGNSASPKLRAWQSTLPGFSSEAPPNLRTSLADRPASYVRGSSPASRNGRDSSSKFGRKSMSPTASRSASSSYSHDRDRFSSQSKGSVASSGDDDVDSMQSVPVSIPDHSVIRKVGAFPNNRNLAMSKKPSRTLSSSSAPKRSFDSALRQMDHRKSPQNMFRPLLSSVPSTTFYVGKTNSAHRSIISRNSSLTTSSNASSEQGVSVTPDTEGSDHYQDDMASELGKAPYPDTQEEVFVFDKVDEINEDVKHEIHNGKANTGHADCDRVTITEVESGESENFGSLDAATAIETNASESLLVESGPSGSDFHEIMLCPKCGNEFRVIAPKVGSDSLCPDCSEKSGSLTPAIQNTTFQSEVSLQDNKPFGEVESEAEAARRNENMLVHHKENSELHHSFNVEQTESCLPDRSFASLVLEEGEQASVDQQVVSQPTVGTSQFNGDTTDQQLEHSINHPSLKVDVSEGAGISVLLKMSSSSKWPVIQGRTFTATNIHCGDPSYARDSVKSMRSSIGHGSASTSSSVDWSSTRQTEARFQRQLSGRKADLENSRHESSTKSQSSGSSFPGIPNHAYRSLFLAKSTSEENFNLPVGHMEDETLLGTPLITVEQGQTLRNDEMGGTGSSFVRAACLEEDKLGHTKNCRMVNAAGFEFSRHTVSIQSEDTSVSVAPNDEDCVSSGIAEDFQNNTRTISDKKITSMTPEFSVMEENAMLNGVCGIDVVGAPGHDSSALISGELENSDNNSTSQADSAVSSNSKSTIDEFPEPSVPTTSENILVSAPEFNTSDHAYGILEESTITVEGPDGQEGRSLTLEEATDTILFCSSIVQNLAYQAAAIGIEKENSVPLEGSHPMVTILGKSSPDRKDPRGRTGSKRTPKSQKARQRRVEADVKTPSTKTESDDKLNESSTNDNGVPNKVDSARPPKLESKCNCSVM